MKYYVKEEIISWPRVTNRKMMGCPCYLAGGKMFAGLVTRGMVITKLTPEEKDELGENHLRLFKVVLG